MYEISIGFPIKSISNALSELGFEGETPRIISEYAVCDFIIQKFAKSGYKIFDDSGEQLAKDDCSILSKIICVPRILLTLDVWDVVPWPESHDTFDDRYLTSFHMSQVPLFSFFGETAKRDLLPSQASVK